MSILVLGLGNALMSDDGFGSRMAEMLQTRFRFSSGVAVLDGGTLGLDLLPRLEGIDRLLIIDALEMDAEPGAVFRLEGEEVPRAFASKLSVHQMGVQDLLAVAELQGHLPSELVVWGVQPGTVEMGLDLTPAVTAATDKVLAGVLEELRAWGVDLRHPPEQF
ncbi:HyaD/HybD family hydrogenase maturation endopeptidase [Desulfuromonas sp. TF]|uniref:HyaD/HybD family hydrogenase maturation endopeptidase n=1 Tax=Desulfuromonas sp. TF TaxID=1232410 RepID=UPI0004075D49|nr:HyaD/HybD family hydrogenase maturation endopeptidase [Desulfuromonas sp. TF]